MAHLPQNRKLYASAENAATVSISAVRAGGQAALSGLNCLTACPQSAAASFMPGSGASAAAIFNWRVAQPDTDAGVLRILEGGR